LAAPGRAGTEVGLSVIVVDDHAAIREALAQLLRAAGLRVLGIAGDAQTGHDLALRRRPDVAVIDIRLADESGIELTERLLGGLPTLAVLLYTGELLEAETVDAVLQRGARGVALKTGDARDLVDAIHRVAAGEHYVDRRLRRSRLGSPPSGVGRLSERERQILRLVADGRTTAEIAAGLFLSPHTVRTHVRNCLSKLDVHTRAQAVLVLERTDISMTGLRPRRATETR
jgi:DNA-binding NarL/FixJ family response regulator